MIIAFDQDVDSHGNVFAAHTIDTSSAAVQAMLTALKASAVSQGTAGFGIVTKHPLYPGQTRWQAILGEVVRLNDTTARPLLGV